MRSKSPHRLEPNVSLDPHPRLIWWLHGPWTRTRGLYGGCMVAAWWLHGGYTLSPTPSGLHPWLMYMIVAWWLFPPSHPRGPDHGEMIHCGNAVAQ